MSNSSPFHLSKSSFAYFLNSNDVTDLFCTSIRGRTLNYMGKCKDCNGTGIILYPCETCEEAEKAKENAEKAMKKGPWNRAREGPACKQLN